MSNKDSGSRMCAILLQSATEDSKGLRLFCDGMAHIKNLYGEITLTDIIEATENLLQNNNKLVDNDKPVT